MSHALAVALAGLVAAQPAANGPKLARGQELVYRGTYSESTSHDLAQFRRSFEIEIMIYVRDERKGELDVAVATFLNSPKSAVGEAVRFELATVSPRGRVRLAADKPAPLFVDGPPALECAGFVEQPAGAAGDWVLADAPRPPLAWHADGIDEVKGVRCRRLRGSQQSPDWERPAPDRPVWRRGETVWVGIGSGIVHRLVRDIEWRSIGERESVLRSRTDYILQSGISTYPGTLGDDRRFETQQADRFQQDLRKLQSSGSRSQPDDYAALVGRIDRFMASKPATPYRPVVEMLRHRAEAGRRGEPPPPDGR